MAPAGCEVQLQPAAGAVVGGVLEAQVLGRAAVADGLVRGEEVEIPGVADHQRRFERDVAHGLTLPSRFGRWHPPETLRGAGSLVAIRPPWSAIQSDQAASCSWSMPSMAP